ncbi:alpha-1,4-glucan--maltose-1-phosphate maltosyltransferase [Subsaximicrobium wynnwilliamsii]|uniref:Alpha-1,4-glucan:maltose-1-phosphate maltosyltransferase n=1 Tax=Subsaximicrobium wynnwilliamsii TaxID=291179 RepID=A0A5C6ZIR9_9FLAO|nr:alpha-1,4-glucan--maltose-1-phosphate maltosyltransferase [Subsaximicrobium wynnwilliamsii]TXD83119.1 alpha-1,4-glucan--maltose-1-phosphate maltosyltransferase [Subsaximicrobium wynnwilliamsii]TXD88863.1 alpha-1,4-glucan--maltose-1-phosphate maltosyltransferase [Subsaximicrobium wynnwilliamsii]TXE02936.1 alpha-1,4-glucan--maltose-1-phosphate maltosyltransferase [Subsaximicrobium wynnwilliamsii]
MQNQKRVVIEAVKPQINCGEHFIKRVINEIVIVNANVFGDGHDVIAVALLYKHENAKSWSETRMQALGNDEWNASFVVEQQGFYSYKVQAWVDEALNWQHGIIRKIEDGQHVNSELTEGSALLEPISKKATEDEKAFLNACSEAFTDKSQYEKAVDDARSEKLHQLFVQYPEKHHANESKALQVYVDRKKARFSTWYEFFPRSASEEKGAHGTFKDCERLLPRIQNMGFDVLYFPPVHPIGEVNRKGKNNTTAAGDGDVGSAWGIGSKDGGHKALHPQLGAIADFKSLIKKAKAHNIEIAMDYALQAAPDHPWVKSHPDWFKWRPDGTVQYAENPPKKYQDILPIYWESNDYKALWDECLDTMLYWIDCGIEVFRVDNPHTKPYFFWNWLISEVKKKHPNVLFLAEAFTRPKVMQRLAKEGYTQSYTYFTWRNGKKEFEDYLTELTQTDQREYMQPNFWPNTPDINPYHLQGATEAKYIQRYALAATMSSSIGIYGPVFEQMIDQAIPGKEEYYMSEKFQICNYDWSKENKLSLIISRINAIRHENEALQQTNNIKFCDIQNDNLIAFYKWNQEQTNELLIIISLDQYYPQQGHVQLPLQALGLQAGQQVQVTDLITGSSYNWYNEWNYVELHPTLPFHIFKIHK